MAEDKNLNVEMRANRTITEQEWAETNRKMKELFAAVEEEFMRTRPIWMRLNLLANKVGTARGQGHTDADIDWGKINKYLKENVSEYDFNNFSTIKCTDDLLETKGRCITATVNVGAWQRRKCKDCGRIFYLMHSEVEFFKDKGLHVPKRCDECRDKRKNESK